MFLWEISIQTRSLLLRVSQFWVLKEESGGKRRHTSCASVHVARVKKKRKVLTWGTESWAHASSLEKITDDVCVLFGFCGGLFPQSEAKKCSQCVVPARPNPPWVIYWTSHSFRKKRKSKLTVKTILRFITVCGSLAALDFILLEIQTVTAKTVQLSSVSHCAFYPWSQDVSKVWVQTAISAGIFQFKLWVSM